MLGAVLGPTVAIALILAGASVKTIILLSFAPVLVSALSIATLTHDRIATDAPRAQEPGEAKKPRAQLPRRFWMMLVGVLLFGLGDFSRSFLVLLASHATGGGNAAKGVTTAVLLYVVHNLVSAAVAYPTGLIGDKKPKLLVLTIGYALGVVTNAMLAYDSTSLPWLAGAIVMSGTYIAIEETIEKATVAELLTREQRSLGLGVLAGSNAVGDMLSSITVGLLLASGHSHLAFALPMVFSALGTLWMLAMRRGR
jgi:MFS family permease